MPPELSLVSSEQKTFRLAFAEREEIALLKAQDKGVREIARAIGRDPGTVSRELRRNAAVRYGSAGVMSFIVNRPAREPGFGLVRQEGPGRTLRYTVHSYATDQPEGQRHGG